MHIERASKPFAKLAGRDERCLSAHSNGNIGTVCSNGDLDTHHSNEVLHSNGKLEDFSDHGSHTLGSNGKNGSLADSGNLETLFSRKELANLYRSSKNPSNEDIQTLCKDGELEMALDGLSRMQTIPWNNTYLSLLQACTKQNSLAQVKLVHAHLASHRLDLTTFLGDYVVTTLIKCGGLDEALHLFRRLPYRTVHSCACLISKLADYCRGREALQMQVLMQEDGIEPNQYIYVGLLRACGTIPDLKEVRKLHGEVQMKGLEGNVYVGTTLVSMYGRCGRLDEAENVFSEFIEYNVILWNAMLTVYIEQKEVGKALLVYRQMLEQGPKRNQGTFVLALQACSILAEKMDGFVRDVQPLRTISNVGQALHADAWRNGFASDVVIGSALVTMYGKCGTFLDAENVFFRLPKHDRALWNAMLSAYVDAGEGKKSLQFYLHMQEEGIIPDEQTVTIALRACGAIAEKEETVVVKQQDTRLLLTVIIEALEKDVRSKGIVVDEILCNMLIFVYGKCGAVAKAEQVFFKLSHHSTVSWNAMLSVYIEHQNGHKVLQAYKRLQEEWVTLDDVALIYVLQACNEMGCLETCKVIHFTLTSADLELDNLLATTLLRTYGGCASIKNVESIFNELIEPDRLSWDACITGYAQEGNCTDALKVLHEMQLESVNPDGVTFTHVLSACNHAGLVEEGINYFNFMNESYGLTPNLRHYTNLIDLFGRAGDFPRVKTTLGKMPMQPDLVIWSCMLNASQTHGNAELENWAFEQQWVSSQGVHIRYHLIEQHQPEAICV